MSTLGRAVDDAMADLLLGGKLGELCLDVAEEVGDAPANHAVLHVTVL